MDRLRAMQVFVRVAERGSFSAAAADLGLSHGMASAVVKETEAALGVELIRRTTRRMALTDEGMAYLAHARRILDEVAEMDEAMRDRGGRVAGRLAVQAPVAFARLLLAPSLGGFLERYPLLRLALLSRDRLPDMVAENIDVLVYVGPLPDSGQTVRTLGRFPLVTAATPAYLARHGMPAHPDELDAHRVIDIVSATQGRSLPWQFVVDGARVLRPVSSALSFESSEAAIAAAVSGAGIVQNISYALSGLLASGALVPVLAGYRDPGPEMHLVTRRYVTVPARVRAFAAHVQGLVRAQLSREAALLDQVRGG